MPEDVDAEPGRSVGESTVRRLALIRQLYLQAVAESERPEPVGALSVLTFHDAVELMAALAAEHLDVKTLRRRAPFEDYWEHIPTLPHREAMATLNTARVSLKHHGVLPSTLNMEAFRASTTMFMVEATRTVFGLDFDRIDMIDLVTFESVRSRLEQAAVEAEKGDFERALSIQAIAFEELVEEFRARTAMPYVIRGADIGPVSVSTDIESLVGFASDVDDALDQLASEASYAVEHVEESLEIVAWGVDLRRYVRFRALTPRVSRSPEKGWAVHAHMNPSRKANADEVAFARAFIIDSALRLQTLR